MDSQYPLPSRFRRFLRLSGRSEKQLVGLSSLFKLLHQLCPLFLTVEPSQHIVRVSLVFVLQRSASRLTHRGKLGKYKNLCPFFHRDFRIRIHTHLKFCLTLPLYSSKISNGVTADLSSLVSSDKINDFGSIEFFLSPLFILNRSSSVLTCASYNFCCSPSRTGVHIFFRLSEAQRSTSFFSRRSTNGRTSVQSLTGFLALMLDNLYFQFLTEAGNSCIKIRAFR